MNETPRQTATPTRAPGPGPWRVSSESAYSAQVKDADGLGVCGCSPRNARLIAAAPELRDALARLVEAANGELPASWPVLDDARALLARLDGKAGA